LLRICALAVGLILVTDVAVEAAQVSPPDDSIQAMVARLDTVESVYDPIVKAIAELGEASIPHVLKKLTSERRSTALASAWVFRRMGSASTVLPLLETWARATSEESSWATNIALELVVQELVSGQEALGSRSTDSDRLALIEGVVCGEHSAPRRSGRCDETGLPPLLINVDGLSDSCGLECYQGDVQFRDGTAPSAADWSVWEDEGRKYVRFKTQILELPESDYAMPSFVAQFGARPVALAVTDVYSDWLWNNTGRREGVVQLWVKVGGEWVYLDDVRGYAVSGSRAG
jgi:hypothetical protein